MITTSPTVDLLIPGQDFSFGTLEHAQALGDLEALIGPQTARITHPFEGRRAEETGRICRQNIQVS